MKRLELISATMSSGQAASGVSVLVRGARGSVQGAAAGTGGEVGPTVCRATLRAVEPFAREALTFVAAEVVEVGGLEIAVSVAKTPRATLIGAAALGDRTLTEAFSRATLDAVNRVLDAEPVGEAPKDWASTA